MIKLMFILLLSFAVLSLANEPYRLELAIAKNGAQIARIHNTSQLRLLCYIDDAEFYVRPFSASTWFYYNNDEAVGCY